MIVPDPPPFPRLGLPLFVCATGAVALGAVALYRALTRKTSTGTATIHPRARGAIPRTTVLVESDGPLVEATVDDVPW